MGREKLHLKRVAKQLGYHHTTPDIFEQISSAKSEAELYRIMMNARHASARRER